MLEQPQVNAGIERELDPHRLRVVGALEVAGFERELADLAQHRQAFAIRVLPVPDELLAEHRVVLERAFADRIALAHLLGQRDQLPGGRH